MTQCKTPTNPRVLTISASEPSGLVGLHSDIRILQALSVHGCSVITALTCQGACQEETASINPVSGEVFLAQLQAVFDRFDVIHGIKIGLLPTLEQAQILVKFLSRAPLNNIPVVYDPVLYSSSGQLLVCDDPVGIFKCLVPVCTLLTPNLNEARQLLSFSQSKGGWLESAQNWAISQQRQWQNDYGEAPALLLKGGHGEVWGQVPGNDCVDLFVGENQQFYLLNKRLETGKHCRGTGCTLASAIAGALALGYELADAVVYGRAVLHRSIRHSLPMTVSMTQPLIQPKPQQATQAPDGNHIPGTQSIVSLHFEADDLPKVVSDLNQLDHDDFLTVGPTPLGLYPVVDSAKWLRRLLPLGIDTIQLRVKNLQGDSLRQEIGSAITIANQYQARLFINDHWELAVELGAYGVHLGQEDLQDASLADIQQAGLRVGISSHCLWEFALAKTLKPSYVATGPVFETSSKDMPWQPQTISGVKYWRSLVDRPLVAIGGITQSHFKDLLDAGADGIAMISAITQADNPEAQASSMQLEIKNSKAPQ